MKHSDGFFMNTMEAPSGMYTNIDLKAKFDADLMHINKSIEESIKKLGVDQITLPKSNIPDNIPGVRVLNPQKEED